MRLRRAITNLVESGPLLKEGMASGNLKVLANLLGPAFRGLIMETAKSGPHTRMPVGNTALFDWEYRQDKAQLQRLYESAKRDQWPPCLLIEQPDSPQGFKAQLAASSRLRVSASPRRLLQC